MNNRPNFSSTISGPSNPLVRLLAALVGALVMVGAFFLGLAAIAVAVGVALLAWLGMSLRNWWVSRNRPPESVSSEQAKTSGEFIEVEYTVVSRKQDE